MQEQEVARFEHAGDVRRMFVGSQDEKIVVREELEGPSVLVAYGEERKTLRVSLGADAVSALLMPLAGSTLPELESVASDVRRMIDDYFFFTEPRTPFSLASTGWQPLGTQRLGGPVNPEDTPVMQVQTPGRALLRGVIKNSYDGACWQDTITVSTRTGSSSSYSTVT